MMLDDGAASTPVCELTDDEWADGAGRPDARRVAPRLEGPVPLEGQVPEEGKVKDKGKGKAAGACPRAAAAEAVDAEREELLAKLLRLIPHATAFWYGGIATSTLRVMVEVPPGGREGPPPTAESALQAWLAVCKEAAARAE